MRSTEQMLTELRSYANDGPPEDVKNLNSHPYICPVCRRKMHHLRTCACTAWYIDGELEDLEDERMISEMLYCDCSLQVPAGEGIFIYKSKEYRIEDFTRLWVLSIRQ